VPNKKVGVVIKKFGSNLPSGQVLADPARDERGPLAQLLYPGRYNEYANPYAYEIKLFDPVVMEPGQEGVVTLMAAKLAADPNQYLVKDGEQGTQPRTEPPGFRYVNLYEKRITPIDVRSQKFEMSGAESIQFPSSDSFTIRMQGFVEWRVITDKLPLIYSQYAEGGTLIPYLDQKVILPYARSLCRLVGSQYAARDFITGDTKLKFQQEFEKRLKDECMKQGIEIRQALVRDIEPPQAIKDPINDREIAKEQIKQYEQQILVAQTTVELTTQEQMGDQNKAIGEANRQVTTVTKKAEQLRDVAVTRAQQDLAVAKLRLDAAQKEADALMERGKAEAAVVLLNKEAEAKPLAQQVTAFGDGQAYAQYFFYQKMAGSVKSVLTNTDGPFGEVFKQFAQPAGGSRNNNPSGAKVTEAKP
jgi:regulator of protease activity HflC (stomatin/prohibitin superfamily)